MDKTLFLKQCNQVVLLLSSNILYYKRLINLSLELNNLFEHYLSVITTINKKIFIELGFAISLPILLLFQKLN